MLKAGAPAAKVLMGVGAAASAGASTVSAAATLNKTVDGVIKEAVAAKKMTTADAARLTDSLRHDVNTVRRPYIYQVPAPAGRYCCSLRGCCSSLSVIPRQNFGTRHESAAIDAYEAQTGWQVSVASAVSRKASD